MLYIVAGSMDQAEHFARSINLKRNGFRYVSGPHILFGIDYGLKYCLVGTWYERRDINEINAVLLNRKAVLIKEGQNGSFKM